MLPLHFALDGFRLLYIALTCYLWFATSLFSREYFAGARHMKRYWTFNLLTFVAIIGVFASADFLTLFVFFEIMSLSSYVLIAHTQEKKALRAAATTLTVSLISGLILLLGLVMLWQRTGTLEFTRLYELVRDGAGRAALYLPAALMLVGFGAKAGVYPLHIWLPKAHPAAPAPASALLSGILTKTGVFGIIALTVSLFLGDVRWGVALMALGAITMVWGALRALVSRDIKKTLACSTVSQIGFIVVGISMVALLGDEGGLAAWGTILHMMNHTLIKLVLFVFAGIVAHGCGSLDYHDIRGFGRGKPLLLFVFSMAALGIGGITFFNVYLSKTLLHESIIEAIHLYHGVSLQLPLQILNALFLFTGGLTIAYMARLFIVLFAQHSPRPTSDAHPYITRSTAVMLALTAALFPLLGSFPPLMNALASWGQGFFNEFAPEQAVHYFTWANEQGMVISLAIAIVVYALVVRGLLDNTTEWGVRVNARMRRLAARVDLEDGLYRPLLKGSVHALERVASILDRLLDFTPRLERFAESPSMVGRFSAGLLFVGFGILVAFLYVFITNPFLR